MSDSPNDPPSALPGQITQPNPLELFWEKNRRYILGVLVILGLGVVGYYVLDYMRRQEHNRRWDLFAQGNQLREFYAPEEGPAFDLLQFWAPTIHWDSKLGALTKDLEALSAAELSDAARKLEDSPGALWCEWVLACKHAAAGRIQEAEQGIERIKARDPGFPALRKLSSPPAYVPLPEKEPGEKDPEAEGEKIEDEPEPPVPDAAALADLLFERASRDVKFRAAHAQLYEAPEPDAKPLVTLETKQGPIKIRLYSERAPKHAANFVSVCKSGYYKGLRFHRVERRGAVKPAFGPSKKAQLAYLGHPDSKEDDRSKWEKSVYSEEQTPFEDSRLSHFPFMLAADREAGKRGSDQKLVYFTASDCAGERDGQYVVFGKVVEGQEVISKIVGGELFSAAEESSGTGRPKESFQITDVKVIE